MTKLVFGIGVGILIVALWFVYGAIGQWLGADSVANLLVNAALFIIVGVGVGVTYRRLIGAKGA